MSDNGPVCQPTASGAVPAPAVPALERRRQHPLGPTLRLKGVGRALLIALAGGGWTPFALVPLVVLAVLRVVEWWSTYYVVAGGVLQLDTGLLRRRRRELRIDRVQQVDVQRTFRHRLFGLSQITVDTAGGSGGEVVLVVGGQEESRLRKALVPADPTISGEVGPAEPRAPAVQVLVRLRPRELALAGLTGAKQLVMVALLAPASQLLDDLPSGTITRVLGLVPTGAGLALLAMAAVLAWFALAVLAQLVADLNFTLTSDGAVLRVRRGFPTQREASLAFERVQLVRVHQTFLQRIIGAGSLQAAAAGSGPSSESRVSRLTVPILPLVRLDVVLAGVLPSAAPLPVLTPSPPAARRRQILRRLVPATVAAAATTALLWPWGALSALAVPLAAGAGELAYRGLGYASTPTHLVTRTGGLWRRIVVVPLRRTQSAQVHQSILQRRAGLATLVVEAAGGGNAGVAVDIPTDVAFTLAAGAVTALDARADERERRHG